MTETANNVSTADMKRQLRQAMQQLRDLPEGWDGAGSSVIDAQLLQTATYIADIAVASRLSAPHVVPLSGGGVQLEWYSPTHGLELVFWPDGTFEYVQLVRPEDIIEEGEFPHVDEGRIRDAMRWFLTAT